MSPDGTSWCDFKATFYYLYLMASERVAQRLEECKYHSYLQKEQEKGQGERTMMLGKVMEQIILEIISRYLKEKKIIESCQHGFTKWKSFLTNLIIFCNEMDR